MSWVWPERLDMYIGRHMALLRRSRSIEISRCDWPDETSLAQMLPHVLDELMVDLPRRPWRMHVALSAYWCPAVGFIVPEGLRNWAELETVAHIAVVDDTDIGGGLSSGLVTQADARHLGLASGCPDFLLNGITQWVRRHGGWVAAIQPLWGIASDCRAMRRKSTTGMLFHEPCTSTVVAMHLPSTGSGRPIVHALSVARENGDDSAAQRRMERYCLTVNIATHELQSIQFCSSVQAVDPALPKSWSGHWRCP